MKYIMAMKAVFILSLTLIVCCSKPLINRSGDELPPVAFTFESDDGLTDSIGEHDIGDYLRIGQERLRVTLRNSAEAGSCYHIRIAVKGDSLIDSMNQARLFYQIFQIVGKNNEKNDSISRETWIPSDGTKFAINVAINALTLPLGVFVLTDFEVPHVNLTREEAAKIDSLSPRIGITYSVKLCRPQEIEIWSHDTTLLLKLPRYTSEKDQKLRSISAMLNDLRIVIARILK